MFETLNRHQRESNHPQQRLKPPQEGAVSLNEVFTSKFMQKFTQFNSINDFLSSGGFIINSEEDYDSIPDAEIDAYVVKTTQFSSWKEMLLDAIDTYKLQSYQ